MKNFLIIGLILSYIFATAFLETESGNRIKPADLMLAGIILISLQIIIANKQLVISRIHIAILPLLTIFLIGSIQAIYPDRAILELTVVFFGFIGSIAIVNLLTSLSDIWLKRFMQGYVIIIGFLALICLIDFLILPGLISSRNLGGLQGPFRNTGQAGHFFGVHFAIILALLMGQVIPRNLIYIIALIIIGFALVFTFKRASILAAITGLALLLLFMFFSNSARDKKLSVILTISFFLIATPGYFLFQWAMEEVPGMKWRSEYKFNNDAVEDFTEGFLAENIRSSFDALSDKPLLGVGLDNVRDIYQNHEIHSTYLGILAYSGIVGTVAYLFFMGVFFLRIYTESRFKQLNPWSSFLYTITPLIMGLVVGWAYTYHLRKREFWILVIFVVLAIRMSKRLRLNH
ncbi:O-antigen ligase family protein [Thiothrix lacustris]|uniref:O-antigen ligase family protein n=1 Tax=Thiothrix lacustris TaxID=525917 RepID=UPI00048CB773|nr:O-antigen ligase family protein [Thiothrix lacustris]